MNTTLRGTSLFRAGAFLSAYTWLGMLEKSNSQTVFYLEHLYQYFILNYHATSSDALKKKKLSQICNRPRAVSNTPVIQKHTV